MAITEDSVKKLINDIERELTRRERMANSFGIDVATELEKARNNFPPINSWHEGYAIILEELHEFFHLVKTKGSTTDNMVKELIQVAAMCQRTAEDVMQKDNPLEHNEPRERIHCGPATCDICYP